jgi:hypothetical protein
MSKLTPAQQRKLEQSAQSEISEDLTQDPNIAPFVQSIATTSQLLAAARARQETELNDLQKSMDELSQEFATRAESIVRSGLKSSYIQARQRIGAIDLSFFDNGEELPHSNNLALMSAVEVEVTES